MLGTYYVISRPDPTWVCVPKPVTQVAAGTTVIVAAEADKTVCIHEVNLSLAAAGTITLQDSDGTVFAAWDVAATGRVILGFVAHRAAGRALAAGKGLSLVSTGGAAKGFVAYSQK